MDQSVVDEVLERLRLQGFVAQLPDGRWVITKAGIKYQVQIEEKQGQPTTP